MAKASAVPDDVLRDTIRTTAHIELLAEQIFAASTELINESGHDSDEKADS